MPEARDKLYSFVETSTFVRQIDRKGSVDLLFQIEDELLRNPERGTVIPGTHGARKARLGDPDRGRGKRGGYRYIYLYLEYRGQIYLLFLYGKNEQGDLSSDQKKALAVVVDQIKGVERNEGSNAKKGGQ